MAMRRSSSHGPAPAPPPDPEPSRRLIRKSNPATAPASGSGTGTFVPSTPMSSAPAPLTRLGLGCQVSFVAAEMFWVLVPACFPRWPGGGSVGVGLSDDPPSSKKGLRNANKGGGASSKGQRRREVCKFKAATYAGLKAGLLVSGAGTVCMFTSVFFVLARRITSSSSCAKQTQFSWGRAYSKACHGKSCSQC